MAKEGAKQNAQRQELLGELTGLRQANLTQAGIPGPDAVPQELARIKEIEAALGLKPNAGLDTRPATQAAPAGETDKQKIKRLEQRNKELEANKARSREAAKIQSAQKTKAGHRKRPDEIMDEALADAEDRLPANWDESNKLAVERTIRKFVRKGGSRKNAKSEYYDMPAGFKKGITLEQMMYALKLLEKMERLSCPIDKIVKMLKDREQMKPGKKRQTAKDFNAKLEDLGVTWDDEFQVPGMSDTLRS